MSATNWSAYGPCDTCDRPAGRQCLDLRYALTTGQFYRNRPHRGRPLLAGGDAL